MAKLQLGVQKWFRDSSLRYFLFDPSIAGTHTIKVSKDSKIIYT